MSIDISEKNGMQEIILDKKGMELEIIGNFHVKGTEKKEISLRIVHKVPSTKASVKFHGVVEDSAFLKITGTIVVEKQAQQTQSFLREKILLLSPSAKAEAIPNLEILANDVKCSHAASITKINEDQLFYLMSRGLSQKQAEQEIVKGFLA